MRAFYLFAGGIMLLLASIAVPAQAQNDWIRNCLPFQVEGHQYKRSYYSEVGELQSFQKMQIDSIRETGDSYKFSVQIYNYNSNGKLLDTTRTTSTIDPEKKELLVNLLPFSHYTKGSEIDVQAKDTCIFYPTNPEPGQKIAPVEVTMMVNEGVVGFLNGKSKIRIYRRRVVNNDTLRKDRYELNTEVSLGVYVFGIRMKSMDYHVTEIVEKKRGIVYQRFDMKEGGYFTVRLIKN